MASTAARSSSAPAAPSVWPICALNGCTITSRAAPAPSAIARARASAASLNGVAVAWALTRSIAGRPASSSAAAAARASPFPSRSGAVRCTASDATPNPVMIRRDGRAPARASARTAAPSPRAMPSRSSRKGRGGGDPVTARSASKPAATKTVTSSNPPARTTSHASRSSHRDGEADRDRTRRARCQHEDARIERTANQPRDARHGPEVRRRLRVGDALASRQASEGALRRAHAAARGPENEPDALVPPLGRTASSSVRQPLTAVASSAVERSSRVDASHARDERPREPRLRELVVTGDGDACPRPGFARARGGPSLPERGHGSVGHDRDGRHDPPPVASGSSERLVARRLAADRLEEHVHAEAGRLVEVARGVARARAGVRAAFVDRLGVAGEAPGGVQQRPARARGLAQLDDGVVVAKEPE